MLEKKNLVQTAGRRHGSLDDKATNVLPALLKQRDEVVDGKHDVSDELVLGHADVTNGNTKAENLLKLELDGGLDVGDLGVHVLAVGERGREFTGWTLLDAVKDGGIDEVHTLGETRTKETRDLLDQTLGSKEGIVLASKLLDELLVLVQLLQVIGGHAIDAVVLGTVKIVLVTENAIHPLVHPSHFQPSHPSTYQMVIPGRGTVGSLIVPEKRLSRWGS